MTLFYTVIVGFAAQLIDGTLGMAYGISATTFLLILGMGPAVASASVHAAEVITTAASGLSHWRMGNVDMRLFKKLVIPGVIGAVLGAYILTTFPAENMKLFVAAYLLIMGAVILFKSLKESAAHREVHTHVVPLGFIGAFLDAIGGGGWGPIVASTLIVKGNHPRVVIGSTCLAEFFVSLAASITFFFTIGFSYWQIILVLALGGIVASPIAAYASKRLPVRVLMFFVGTLIVALSIRTFVRAF